jgi:predicted DNA-binding protein YlxM (UPF0122 family)
MASNLFLSKESSEGEIKAYFNAILKLSKCDNEFPVNLDEVWMLAYSEKGKATRALKENFIEGIDYQVLAQNGKNLFGGRPTTNYYLTVPCLEFLIARKIRLVFEVYRQVFHKVNEIAPKVAKSSAADKRKITRLQKEIETLEERLKWAKWSERREIELKCSCFHYLVANGLYNDWSAFHRREEQKSILDSLLGML